MERCFSQFFWNLKKKKEKKKSIGQFDHRIVIKRYSDGDESFPSVTGVSRDIL